MCLFICLCGLSCYRVFVFSLCVFSGVLVCTYLCVCVPLFVSSGVGVFVRWFVRVVVYVFVYVIVCLCAC